ncbi:MAG: RimK family alpha-L-glutamate ligase [Desulfurococcales archaeon]|nr:RimK family alpha-L-glutamate ligase [Desulfurococcales archaeon]
MTFRIAVIHDTPHMVWSVRQLFRRIIEKGHTPYYLRVTSVPYSLEGGLAIAEDEQVKLDGAIVKGLGDINTAEEAVGKLGLIKSLELSGTVVINPFESLLLSRDKITQLLYLSEGGLPTPETIMTWSVSTALRYLSKWGKAIIKPVIGSLGRGVMLIDDEDRAFYDLSTVLRSGQPIYIQRYIEKPGRDIRVFVVGGKILGGMYRVSMGWKTNIARGAKPVKAELNGELEELALRATRILGLEFAGVDIAEDVNNGSYLVLEVNSAPLWRGFYHATRTDPSEYIVERLLELIKEKVAGMRTSKPGDPARGDDLWLSH